jgi:hypothetical protein
LLKRGFHQKEKGKEKKEGTRWAVFIKFSLMMSEVLSLSK